MKKARNFGDKPMFTDYPAGHSLGKCGKVFGKSIKSSDSVVIDCLASGLLIERIQSLDRFFREPSFRKLSALTISLGLFFLFFGTLLLTNCHALQQSGQTAQTLDQTIQESSIDALLTQLAIKHLPLEYVDDRKWGMQAERWDGVKFERKNGQITTHRRWKTVNDGTWKKYSVRPRNPQQTLSVQLTNIRELDEGQVGGRLGFTVVGSGDVDFQAQIVDWKKGIKAYSISLEGHGSSQVEVDLELAIQVDGLKFPPDIILFPRATDVRLQLDEFRIDRIGKVGGEIAQQIGREARKQLERKLPEQRQKLLEKINRELSKKEDGHRISFSEIKGSKFNDAISKLIGN